MVEHDGPVPEGRRSSTGGLPQAHAWQAQCGEGSLARPGRRVRQPSPGHASPAQDVEQLGLVFTLGLRRSGGEVHGATTGRVRTVPSTRSLVASAAISGQSIPREESSSWRSTIVAGKWSPYATNGTTGTLSG